MEPSDGSSQEPRGPLRFAGKRITAKEKLARARARNARAELPLAVPVVSPEEVVLVEDVAAQALPDEDEGCPSPANSWAGGHRVKTWPRSSAIVEKTPGRYFMLG